MSTALGSTRRRGWRPSGKPARHLFAAHAASRVDTTPSLVDWLSQAPPIFDQGLLGSCFGHGRARAITTAARVLGKPLPFVVSPDRLYRLTRAMMRAAGELGPITAPLTDSGSDPSKGSEGITIFGVSGMWRPATPDGRVSDCAEDTVNDEPDLAEVSADAHHIITGEFGIDSVGRERVLDLRKALAVAPACGGFFCDMGFERWRPGDPPYGAPVDPNDPEGGGHFICYDGYFTQPDGSTLFIVANSWSERDWGDRGRILVTEEFVTDPQNSDLTAELLLKDIAA